MLGRVSDIGLRATTVTTFDGADVVVPNGLLLADKLVNWTLRGTRRRINLDFGIAYSVDPRPVTELLAKVAREVERRGRSPAPAALVVGLANGVQDISLRAWTPGPRRLGAGAQRTGDARARGPGRCRHRDGPAAARAARAPRSAERARRPTCHRPTSRRGGAITRPSTATEPTRCMDPAVYEP